MSPVVPTREEPLITEPTPLRAEDLPVGIVLDLGSYTVTHREIVEFATQWDPQPFHLDDEAGSRTRFGGIIGSGLHSLAILQRLSVLGAYRHWAVVAGRATRDIQFTSPLRPGATVRGEMEVLRVEPTHPDRALVTKRSSLLDGQVPLLTMETDSYVARRQ